MLLTYCGVTCLLYLKRNFCKLANWKILQAFSRWMEILELKWHCYYDNISNSMYMFNVQCSIWLCCNAIQKFAAQFCTLNSGCTVWSKTNRKTMRWVDAIEMEGDIERFLERWDFCHLWIWSKSVGFALLCTECIDQFCEMNPTHIQTIDSLQKLCAPRYVWTYLLWYPLWTSAWVSAWLCIVVFISCNNFICSHRKSILRGLNTDIGFICHWIPIPMYSITV